jgi:tryptophanyl-tRNA synthetase
MTRQVHLSGIQPSGLLHLGNYFGAIRQHIANQDAPGEHFYFIADFHALTSVRDADALREYVREVAVTYLALGLDPAKCALWRQSDVPEVLELAWLLGTVTGMGLLERAHSYKDKVAKGIKPSVGLFTYPVLMAADILAFDSTLVPVGKDQVQHLEMTQDMAASFNHAFGAEVFVRPEPLLAESEAMQKVPGLDGQKMSKSYGNTIWMFEEGKALKKCINRIVTDSRPPEEPKDPAELFLFDLMALFLPPAEVEEWKERVRRGGEGAPGYGHLKGVIRDGMDAHFAPARERRKELLADPAELERILASGAEKARARATEVLDRARRACGLR